MARTMIRFECGVEDRCGRVWGPFDYVQLTYDELRVGPEGEFAAQYIHSSPRGHGRWIMWDPGPFAADPDWYSDVIIYTEEA